jgi:branched-chain amino acid transport system ATP-binding protein
MAEAELLTIRGLTKAFGGLTAVDAVNMDVRRGEILGLIGPNGAGKSTVLNMIGGTLRPKAGQILFQGQDITAWPPFKRARRGITRVFQRNALFPEMTVLENVLAGAHLHRTHGFVEVFYKRSSVRKKTAALRDEATEILRLVGLDRESDHVAAGLPHGSQRLLCTGVALAASPTLLLLDEPLTGMNAEETSNMIGLVKGLRDTRGITVIVVEHNVKAVLDLCDRAIVLNYGRMMTEGAPGQVIQDKAVIEAYLGADDAS